MAMTGWVARYGVWCVQMAWLVVSGLAGLTLGLWLVPMGGR